MTMILEKWGKCGLHAETGNLLRAITRWTDKHLQQPRRHSLTEKAIEILELDDGFFTTDEWKGKSKDIIKNYAVSLLPLYILPRLSIFGKSSC